MYFILDPGFLIMQYECNLYWTSWSTDSHSNETKKWIAVQHPVDIPGCCIFFLWSERKYFFNILTIWCRNLFQAPKHVYMNSKEKKERKFQQKTIQFICILSGGLAINLTALNFFVNYIFQFILLYRFLVVFLS